MNTVVHGTSGVCLVSSGVPSLIVNTSKVYSYVHVPGIGVNILRFCGHLMFTLRLVPGTR